MMLGFPLEIFHRVLDHCALEQYSVYCKLFPVLQSV